jgi:hypothetical protein
MFFTLFKNKLEQFKINYSLFNFMLAYPSLQT